MKKVDIKNLKGTAFQKRVWREIIKIPRGKTITYKELARRIGKPFAARAVGNAVGKNPFPLIIPCYKVIRSNGTLGGYSGRGGIKTKRILLKKEKMVIYAY